jgi:hypothetical protein
VRFATKIQAMLISCDEVRYPKEENVDAFELGAKAADRVAFFVSSASALSVQNLSSRCFLIIR